MSEYGEKDHVRIERIGDVVHVTLCNPEARNARHTHLAADEGRPTWRVQQMLVDPEMLNDWVAEFEVDVEASRARQQPVLWLTRVGPLQ